MSINLHPSEDLRTVDRELLEAMRGIDVAGQHGCAGDSEHQDSVGIGQLTEQLGVTATAVRQRIDRLLEMGLIEREKIVHGRGRPTYRYRMTVTGHRRSGANPIDLAEAMWREILAIPDPEAREHVLAGIAGRLGRQYAAEMPTVEADATFEQRMHHLSQLMAARHISAEVSNSGDLPVLDICNCPYPSLTDSSEQRAMCHLEEQMISEALGQEVHLSSCFLDGDTHCQFTAATNC
jgi:predicted ArsR family transcriptional regulator